jgi:hypothetical protein
MMMLKICIVCDKEFLQSYYQQKCCCSECSKKYRKESHSKYKGRYKNKKCLNPKICVMCNKEFIPKHGNKKYCSDECYRIFLLKQKQIRRKLDPNFKILSNSRIRIYYALKSNTKKSSTKELLGCTVEELWSYLEKQFKPGMTKENYGEWHVDHIKPCASFDLSKEENQKKCFHYTNLQPL